MVILPTIFFTINDSTEKIVLEDFITTVKIHTLHLDSCHFLAHHFLSYIVISG